jgi:predicted nucleic acid-binding protein
MKKKLYIETSVWNQLEHSDRQDWRETAEQFFQAVGLGEYDAYISNVVIDEILATTDTILQQKLVAHINKFQPILLEMDDGAAALTRQYIDAEFGGRASQRVYRDCSHVAIATINNIKHVVSFNCRHLVNDRRIDAFNAVNIRNGYDHFVDISTPHKFLPLSEKEQLL